MEYFLDVARGYERNRIPDSGVCCYSTPEPCVYSVGHTDFANDVNLPHRIAALGTGTGQGHAGNYAHQYGVATTENYKRADSRPVLTIRSVYLRKEARRGFRPTHANNVSNPGAIKGSSDFHLEFILTISREPLAKAR